MEFGAPPINRFGRYCSSSGSSARGEGTVSGFGFLKSTKQSEPLHLSRALRSSPYTSQEQIEPPTTLKSFAWQVATVVVGLFGGDKQQSSQVDRGAGFRFLDGLVSHLFTTFYLSTTNPSTNGQTYPCIAHCVQVSLRCFLYPCTAGYAGTFPLDTCRKLVVLSAGFHPCPYGWPTVGSCRFSTRGLFKKPLCNPLCE